MDAVAVELSVLDVRYDASESFLTVTFSDKMLLRMYCGDTAQACISRINLYRCEEINGKEVKRLITSVDIRFLADEAEMKCRNIPVIVLEYLRIFKRHVVVSPDYACTPIRQAANSLSCLNTIIL